MWTMVQQPTPDDYVIATGKTHSVREFCQYAFGCLDLDYEQYVKIDPRFYRPVEVEVLQVDASKARRVLGWEPTIGLGEIVREMVMADMARLQRSHPPE